MSHDDGRSSPDPHPRVATTAGSRQPAFEKRVVAGLARLPAFCHAVVAGDLVFVSGTLGTRGEALTLVPGGVAPQTRQAIENVRLILEACGSGLPWLTKVDVYLADMGDYDAMNQAYLDAIGGEPPARMTVGRAALALGAAVEITAVAYRPPAGT